MAECPTNLHVVARRFMRESDSMEGRARQIADILGWSDRYPAGSATQVIADLLEWDGIYPDGGTTSREDLEYLARWIERGSRRSG